MRIWVIDYMRGDKAATISTLGAARGEYAFRAALRVDGGATMTERDANEIETLAAIACGIATMRGNVAVARF